MSAVSSTVNSENSEATGETTENKKQPREVQARKALGTQNRDSTFETRRHKSIFRLPASQRTDSREQMYRMLDADEGQSHE